jgi:hypothetical protein
VTVFYEAIGVLLRNGGERLRDLGAAPEDDRSERELRQLSLLLRRLGEIWPDLPSSLQEELAVLASTLDDVGDRFEAAGVEWEPSRGPPSDPVRRYRWLLARLEVAVAALHDRRGEPWAGEGLRAVRSGLSAAAEVQGRLVDRALVVR